MSTNCLVTKLKGVVYNDNLTILGNLRVRIANAQDEQYSQIDFNKLTGPSPTLTAKGNITVKAENVNHQNETWTQNVTTYPNTKTTATLRGSTEGYLDITLTKPGLKLILSPQYVALDKSFKTIYAYCPESITQLISNAGAIFPEDGNNKLSVWMSLISDGNLYEYVKIITLHSSNVVNDVTDGASFGKYTSLTSLNLKKDIDPDAVATAMVGEGRTSGTLRVQNTNNVKWDITFDPSASGGYTKTSV